MTTAIVLFDYWRSSASYRVRIALGLKQLDFAIEPVDLLERAHRTPQHLARNPQGLVPALAIDGLMLTQSLAIIGYLDETRPEPPLLPSDPAARARVQAAAHSIAMDIHPICNLRVVAHVGQLLDGGDEARVAWMRHFIGPGLEAFESLLAEAGTTGPFCFGEQPTIADCCLIPQLYNAERWGVGYRHLERIVAAENACRALRAVAVAHPDAVRPPTEAAGLTTIGH